MNVEPVTYIIDDDKAVRDSLQWLIESVGLQVRTYETAQHFLEEVDHNAAGCLVLDVRLPGMSGLDLLEHMEKIGISLPTIMITGHGDVPVAVRAMKAGAVDFIEKPFSDQVLLDRVRDALERNKSNRRNAAEMTEIQLRLAKLTPRERQVMRLVVQGKLNKQIATELGLSHKTIEVHRAHVMEKMGAASLAELVRMVVACEETAPSSSERS